MDEDSLWAQLPEDPLRDIAIRLECLGDLVAFASVCSSWRAAYISIKPVWKPTMPWLIMAENNDENPQCLRTVVDLSTNRRYQMGLPETFGRRCWGCEHGWIFTLSLDMETHLFNPLTRVRLSLPSFQTLLLKDYCLHLYSPKCREMVMRGYINKVRVICVPPNEELLVMVVYYEGDLAIAKPGDSKWFSIEGHHNSQDLLHYKDYIAAVDINLSLELAKADVFLRMGNPFVEALLYPYEDESFNADDVGYNVYLANDPFGGILTVLHHVSESEVVDGRRIYFSPNHYEVFSFDFAEKTWKRLYDLGDRAVFVGNNAAVCLVASKCPNCKPNCIYFTDGPVWSSEISGLGAGIFNMEDLSMERVYHGVERVYHGVDIPSLFCPQFWFMPKLV